VRTTLLGPKPGFQAIFDACGFGSIKSLCAHDATDKVNKYLKSRTDIGEQTKNHYPRLLDRILSLGRKGTDAPYPLSRLEKVSIRETSRNRRAISSKDLEKVFAAARRGTKVLRMTGEQRYWVYRLATESGLRAAELGSLTPADFLAGYRDRAGFDL